MLHKYKKNETQWFRVASLLKIMYNYLNDSGNIDIKTFFDKNTQLSYSTLREVEELWKTEHIFMTPDEMVEFKNGMDFFKSK